MALPYTVAKLHSAIADRAPQDFEDGLTKRSTLYRMLEKNPKGGPSDAKGPRFRLKTSGNDSVDTFEVGGTLLSPGAFQDTEVAFHWGNYQGHFSLAHRQIEQIRNAGDDMLIERLFGSQLDEVEAAIVNKIETDLNSGSTSSATAGSIIGLDTQIADTGTVGGVDKSATSAFASYVKDNGGGGDVSLTVSLMDDVYNNLTQVIEGSQPDVILCKYDLRDFAGELATGAITTQTQIGQNEGRQSKFLGYTDVFYRNIPVVAVPGRTANRMDFVNTDMMWIEYLPSPTGGLFHLLEPERSGDTWTWTILCYLQLVVRNPRKSCASLQEVQAS